MTTTLLTLRPGPWVRDARCTPADATRLDAIVGGHPTPEELEVRTAAATELCAHCPVARICVAEADLHADVGVRGGSLRYRAGGPRGEYTVRPLIPDAVPSVHDRNAVARRVTRKRDAVLGPARSLVHG